MYQFKMVTLSMKMSNIYRLPNRHRKKCALVATYLNRFTENLFQIGRKATVNDMYSFRIDFLAPTFTCAFAYVHRTLPFNQIPKDRQ